LFSKNHQEALFAEQLLKQNCLTLNKVSWRGGFSGRYKTKKAVFEETAFAYFIGGVSA